MRLTPAKFVRSVNFMSNHNEGEGRMGMGMEEPTPPVNPIEAWRIAPAQVVNYPQERVATADGSIYFTPEGKRLMIGDTPVMDTCETPWADKTIELAFSVDQIKRLPGNYKLKVLERGAGLNITGTRIIQRLMGRGLTTSGSAEYHVIELNEDVADMAEQWKGEMDRMVTSIKAQMGTKFNVDIFVHRGEAKEVTRRLILGEGNKFNIILSDTYPLTREEKGINDIEDLDVISRGLYKNSEGVFAFFPFYKGSEEIAEDGYMASTQSAMLRPYFPHRITAVADIKPPTGYTYLFRGGSAVRKLPVIVCTKNGS